MKAQYVGKEPKNISRFGEVSPLQVLDFNEREATFLPDNPQFKVLRTPKEIEAAEAAFAASVAAAKPKGPVTGSQGAPKNKQQAPGSAKKVTLSDEDLAIIKGELEGKTDDELDAVAEALRKDGHTVASGETTAAKIDGLLAHYTTLKA